MPTPTIGAKVDYRENGVVYPAVITGIHGDDVVDLSVTDSAGKGSPKLGVPLVQVEWPKAEVVTENPETPTEETPPPVKAKKKPTRKAKKK
jgi:hypothetical protein